MNYILLIITVPLTLFALAFAASNAQDVTVRLMPFSETWTAPLGLVALGMMGAGFFFGALFVWMHGHKARFRHWRDARRADRLEKELTALQAKNGTSV